MRHKHYAPRARMSLVQGSPEVVRAALLALSAGSGERTWVLALDDVLEGHSAAGLKSLGRDARGAAHRLFHLLRLADEEGVERIYAQGLAVMNRLVRASGFDVLDAESILHSKPLEQERKTK